MKVPGMSDIELEEFLKGAWVAKLGTLSADGAIRITPLWYDYRGTHFLLSCPARTNHVRNLKRNSESSLMIDSEREDRGVHYTGLAEIDEREGTAEEIGKMFARYLYDKSEEGAVRYGERIKKVDRSFWGKRVFAKFYPRSKITWDYNKPLPIRGQQENSNVEGS